MKFIDDILNRITMYRLVLYYLIGLIARCIHLRILRDLAVRSDCARILDDPHSHRLCVHQLDLRPRIRSGDECRIGLYHGADLRAHHHAGHRDRSCRRRLSHLRVGVGDGVEIYFRDRQETHLQPRGIRGRLDRDRHQPVRHMVDRRQRSP